MIETFPVEILFEIAYFLNPISFYRFALCISTLYRGLTNHLLYVNSTDNKFDLLFKNYIETCFYKHILKLSGINIKYTHDLIMNSIHNNFNKNTLIKNIIDLIFLYKNTNLNKLVEKNDKSSDILNFNLIIDSKKIKNIPDISLIKDITKVKIFNFNNDTNTLVINNPSIDKSISYSTFNIIKCTHSSIKNENNFNYLKLKLYKSYVKSIDFNDLFIINPNLRLYITFNFCLDIDYSNIFKSIKNINSLTINNTNISDISFLLEFKSITILDLGYNNISNIDCLRKFHSFYNLDLNNNKLKEFIGVWNIKNSLNLSHNKIKNIVINSKSYLVNLSNNKITDITNLFLSKVEYLNLNNNRIKSLYVDNLINLHSLNISNNMLEGKLELLNKPSNNVNPLLDLRYINVSYNKLIDVTFLYKFINIFEINVYYNPINHEIDISNFQNSTFNLIK